jgi:uncharacterized protein YdaU (DUF1376 family)
MSVTSHHMPWYIGDYLRDTQHLETIEHGAYLLLIAHAWQHDGAIPGDHERLRKITKLSPEQWAKSGSTIMEFWTKNSQTYRHKRVDEELIKARALYQQKVDAGRASAAQRAFNGRSTDVIASAQRAFNEPDPEPDPYPKPESEGQPEPRGRSKAFAPQAALRDVDPQIVADWLQVRKVKKTANTKTAFDAVRAEAEKAGLSMQATLKLCCERGWAGFKASWPRDDSPHGAGGNGASANKQAQLEASNAAVVQRLIAKGPKNEN